MGGVFRGYFRWNFGKFLKGKASSGHKKSIEELLGDANSKGMLENVKAAAEVKALENFYITISNDPDRACYGFQTVLTAGIITAVHV